MNLKTTNVSLLQKCAIVASIFVFAIGVMFAPLQQAHAQVNTESFNREQLIALIMQLIAQLSAFDMPQTNQEVLSYDLSQLNTSVKPGEQIAFAYLEAEAEGDDVYVNSVYLGAKNLDGIDAEEPWEAFEKLIISAQGKTLRQIVMDDESSWQRKSFGYQIQIFDGNTKLTQDEIELKLTLVTSDGADNDSWELFIPTKSSQVWTERGGHVKVGNQKESVRVVVSDSLKKTSDVDVSFISSKVSTFENDDTTTADDEGEFRLKFEVTALDSDISISQTAAASFNPGKDGELSFEIQDSKGRDIEKTESESVSITFVSTAKKSSSFHVVREGQTETFDLIVRFNPINSGFYRLAIEKLGYVVGQGGGIVNILSLDDEFRTDFVSINSDGTGGTTSDDDGSDEGGGDDVDENEEISNSADDVKRKQDLKEIARALVAYQKKNGTFEVANSGYFNTGKNRQTGRGWFAYSCGSKAGCLYPTSVAEALVKGGYTNNLIADPTGITTSSRSKDQTGYMILTDLKEAKGNVHFTLWANLDNPTAADLATLEKCKFSQYDNYHRNNEVSRQTNYCIDGSAASFTVDAPAESVQIEDNGLNESEGNDGSGEGGGDGSSSESAFRSGAGSNQIAGALQALENILEKLRR